MTRTLLIDPGANAARTTAACAGTTLATAASVPTQSAIASAAPCPPDLPPRRVIETSVFFECAATSHSLKVSRHLVAERRTLDRDRDKTRFGHDIYALRA